MDGAPANLQDLLARGQIDAARSLVRQSLRQSPRQSALWRAAAQVEVAAGHAELAVELNTAAVRCDPDDPASHRQLGQALGACLRWDDACKAFEAAVRLDPNSATTWLELADAQARISNHRGALQSLMRCKDLAGRNPSIQLRLAQTHWQLGETAATLAELDDALSHAPTEPRLHHYRGLVLKETGHPQAALQSLQRALDLRPDDAQARLHRGIIQQAMGRAEAARQDYLEAMRRDPADPLPHAYLGLQATHDGRLQEARAYCQAALARDPACVPAHDFLARLELSTFNFERGWSEYAWRHRGQPDHWARTLPAGAFLERPDDGRPLYVLDEQGIGDQILFASMFAELQARAHVRAAYVDPKLATLMRRSFPDLDVRIRDASPLQLAPGEGVMRMGDLGRHLRPDIGSFRGARVPYLLADIERARQMVDDLPRGPGRLVGISWQSSRKDGGAAKSIPLKDLVSALQTQQPIRLVSLQYGDVEAEIADVQRSLGVRIHLMRGVDALNDLDALAALMTHCDHVVSSSSITAHLAAALGRPTIVIVPKGYGRLWYWHDVDGRSPWYPHARIVAQHSPGDWRGALQGLGDLPNEHHVP